MNIVVPDDEPLVQRPGEVQQPKSGFSSPCFSIYRIHVSKIRGNQYNPNRMSGSASDGSKHSEKSEFHLLYLSILSDGYTMPIVCYYNAEEDVYEIVDGFHRYAIMLEYPDIYEREGGFLPVSLIDKDLSERMASTIRHNRARGAHDVDLMSNIVSELHKLGRSDKWIAKYLGMEADEVLRLKQITGLAELFKDREFSKAWTPEDAEDDVVLTTNE